MTLSTLRGLLGQSGMTLALPLMDEGTRHEYEQVKPQPYSNLPEWIVLPAALTILKRGAGGR